MILILGKSGYISQKFQKFFEFKKIDYKAVSYRERSGLYNLKEFIRGHNSSFVINCIGYTGKPNVDACENAKEECLYLNSLFPELVGLACEWLGINYGHVSSGCIYNNPLYSQKYNEEDKPNFSFELGNCSWYSGTKALGEKLINPTLYMGYVWRLRMPFDNIPSDKNYLSKLLNYPKVWSSPNSITNVDEFVKVCWECVDKKVPYGIYNITNHGDISAYKILEIMKKYGIRKDKYEYFESELAFKPYIKTPRSNCVLDTSKLKQNDLFINTVETSLEKTLEQWNKDTTIFW